MEKPTESREADGTPNFYESIFGGTLSPEKIEENRQNHHFGVEDIDATLSEVQKYIDEYGGWKILLPKTPISFGFIAAVAVDVDNSSEPPDIIFLDENPRRTTT